MRRINRERRQHGKHFARKILIRLAGMNKILLFHLFKLSHAIRKVARSNFVSECLADLANTKRQLGPRRSTGFWCAHGRMVEAGKKLGGHGRWIAPGQRPQGLPELTGRAVRGNNRRRVVVE